MRSNKRGSRRCAAPLKGLCRFAPKRATEQMSPDTPNPIAVVDKPGQLRRNPHWIRLGGSSVDRRGSSDAAQPLRRFARQFIFRADLCCATFAAPGLAWALRVSTGPKTVCGGPVHRHRSRRPRGICLRDQHAFFEVLIIALLRQSAIINHFDSSQNRISRERSRERDAT